MYRTDLDVVLMWTLPALHANRVDWIYFDLSCSVEYHLAVGPDSAAVLSFQNLRPTHFLLTSYILHITNDVSFTSPRSIDIVPFYSLYPKSLYGNMNMPIGSSRYKLLFSLILVPYLVYGNPQGWVAGPGWGSGRRQGESQGWIAAGPPDTYAGPSSPPSEQSPPYIGNLSAHPSQTYPSKCDVCTLSVSVSSDSVLLFCNTLMSIIVSFALLLASRVDEYGLSCDGSSTTLSYISI